MNWDERPAGELWERDSIEPTVDWRRAKYRGDKAARKAGRWARGLSRETLFARAERNSRRWAKRMGYSGFLGYLLRVHYYTEMVKAAVIQGEERTRIVEFGTEN